MKNKLMKVAGAALKVGDVLVTNGTEEEIVDLKPYKGQSSTSGSQVATLLKRGDVIVDNLDYYTIVVGMVES